MQGAAMKPLNIIGNRLFSAIFSFLLGQPITDTLCGTKVLMRRDWPAMTGRVRNGLVMLRMCWAAFRKFKLG
jgi:hypothetical protein